MSTHPLAPDLILTHGRIYTLNPQQPWAEAVAIRDAHIIALGSNQAMRALASPATRTLHLGGRLVLPGLCDAHIHLHEWSLNLARPQLAAARSLADMLDRIRTHAQRQPADAWITCQGWNESWWGATDFPTAADLDSAAGPHQALLCYRSDMHIAVANHAALARAGITAATPDPPGGLIDRDAHGRPTGVLRELAIGLVSQHVPPPTVADLTHALSAAFTALHQLGITAVHDQRIKDGSDGPRMLAALSRLRDVQQLPLRVHCNIAAHQLPALAALGLRSGFGDDTLRLGHLKVFADGSLGSRTAWMLAPFAATDPSAPAATGLSVTPPEQMAVEFQQAQLLGFPISVHAIGDRANRTVLDIFAELRDRHPALPIPHRIEHAQTLDAADIPRFAALGITASVQPIHLLDDRDTADHYLGARTATTYAFHSLLASGARLAFGSDAPVADPNPFLGLTAALTRNRPGDARGPWHANEQIHLPAALRAYTASAAEAAGWQTTIGSLAPGRRADLIVLDRDLFALAHDPAQAAAIAETQVLLTLMDGQIVYRHPVGDFGAA